MSSLVGFLDYKMLSLPVWSVILIYIAVLSLMVAIASWKKWLTLSGNIAAFLLGLFILYLGGFSAFLVLLFFFIAGSLMGKVVKSFNLLEKKGDRRDCFQVLANGIPALIALLLYHFTPYKDAGLIAFASALSEALADTWAGDIGRLSTKDPVSIITFTKVPKGISGGVTMLGFIGSFVASFLIALMYIGTYSMNMIGFMIVLVFGFVGAIVDSVLGATIQVHYRDSDGHLTEKSEKDGKKLERARGIPFIDNDGVNFISGLFSASLGFAFALILM